MHEMETALWQSCYIQDSLSPEVWWQACLFPFLAADFQGDAWPQMRVSTARFADEGSKKKPQYSDKFWLF